MRKLIFAIALVTLGCPNPNHSDAVDALGGEASGVREGPEHRPGQPCLTCHGGDGPGPDFVIAGTIYAKRNQPAALAGVDVYVTDSSNPPVTKHLQSNRVGNFYMPSDEWSPSYPLSVHLESGGTRKDMNSLIGRNGGCAFCHYGPDNESSHMPPVFLSEQ